MPTSSPVWQQRPATKYILRGRPLKALPSRFSHQHMHGWLSRKRRSPKIIGSLERRKAEIVQVSILKSMITISFWIIAMAEEKITQAVKIWRILFLVKRAIQIRIPHKANTWRASNSIKDEALNVRNKQNIIEWNTKACTYMVYWPSKPSSKSTWI